jgi:hypothetical protein
MLATRRNQFIAVSILIAVVAILLVIYANSALAGSNTSTADVYWSWDTSNQVGTSNLVRNKNGISAEYSTDGLPGGQAMTLWFIVFNNPEACEAGAFSCGLADMGADRSAQGDFLLASGHVIDEDGTATFNGNLEVGDIGGSGLAEFEGGSFVQTQHSACFIQFSFHSHSNLRRGYVTFQHFVIFPVPRISRKLPTALDWCPVRGKAQVVQN